MTSPRWLSDQQQRSWRAFNQAQVQLGRRLSGLLAEHADLSDADYAVLVCLSEAPDERVRARDISADLGWEKSRLSHHLTRMERRGLVERRDCETDARGADVVLTAAGRAAIEAAAPQHVEDVRTWFIDALTPAQLECLGSACEAIVANLDDAG